MQGNSAPIRTANGFSGIHPRSGRQRMAYVLLPHRSQLKRFYPNEAANELPPSLPNVRRVSESLPAKGFAPESSDDDHDPSSTSDSDYAELGRDPCSNPVFGGSVGQKRLRNSDGEESGVYTSSGTGNLTKKDKARHPKRSRRAVFTLVSEREDTNDEEDFSTNSVSSSHKLEVPAPSASRKVAQKKTKGRNSQTNVRQWSNLSSRVVITKDHDEIRFIFNGQECKHFPDCNSSDSVTDSSFTTSRVPLPDFDDSCAALKAFNMCFYRPLNMVFCKTHKKCLPLASLKSHITSSALVSRHTHTLPRIKTGNTIELFTSHVALAFDLPPDQTFHSQGSNTKQLLKPIPYLTEPRLYLQCPVCKVWLCEGSEGGWNSSNIRHHLQKNDKCAQRLQVPESERPALKTCFAQRPCGTGGTGLETQVPLVEIIGWRPLAVNSEEQTSIQEPKNLTKPIDASSQEYANDLKWREFFPQETAECIRLLCLLPNPHWNLPTAAHPVSHQNKSKILERGLYEVHTFLQHYLQEANEFLDSCDPGLRRQITKGTKSQYNVILTSAYADYRHPLMHAVALLLRYKFHHESGQQIPGSFELPMTKSLNETRIALYEFLLSVTLHDGIDRPTLGFRVHALLVSLLTAKCKVRDRIGHVFDITIPIALYKGNGIYRTANSATQYCAWLQFCLRSVAIQVTRLGGMEKLYVPFEKIVAGMRWSGKALELNDDGWGHSSEGVGSEDLDVVGDIIILPAGEKMGGKRPEPIFFVDESEKANTRPLSKASPGSLSVMEEGSQSIKEDTLLVVLDEMRKWLQWDAQSRDNISTAFTRLKNTWFQIGPYAKIANPVLLIEWEQGDQAFTFTDSQDLTPRRLTLSTIFDMASYFIHQVQECLESFLPSGFSRSLLNTHSLKDDLTGTPISEQEANLDITKPIIDKLHHAVLQDVHSYKPRVVQNFLQKEQELLAVLLVTIVLTMGIPPQAGQLADIRYRASLDGCRNIFLSNQDVLLAMPQRRVNSRKYPALVWTFPLEVGDVLLFYLSVIRPTAIKLIETSKEKPHLDFFTHLFASNQARRPGRRAWSPRRVSTTIENAIIQRTQLRLTLSQLYRIVKEIYEHHFPFVTISQRIKAHTTTANLQAGHQQITADFHYGLSQGFPPGISMSNTVFLFRLEKSRIWHGVIGASPSHWSVAEDMGKILSVAHRHNQIATLHRVRWLICRFYDFSGTLDRSSSRARATEILQTQPFLKFPVHTDDAKFDQVMIEVAAVMQGRKETHPTTVDPHVVSDAISLIVLALEELASEEDPPPVFDLYNSTTASLFQAIQHLVASKVDSFARNKLLWQKLELEICKVQARSESLFSR